MKKQSPQVVKLAPVCSRCDTPSTVIQNKHSYLEVTVRTLLDEHKWVEEKRFDVLCKNCTDGLARFLNSNTAD